MLTGPQYSPWTKNLILNQLLVDNAKLRWNGKVCQKGRMDPRPLIGVKQKRSRSKATLKVIMRSEGCVVG